MPSLFVDRGCSKRRESAVTTASWSQTENLLAVAWDDGRVEFYQDEATLLESSTITQSNRAVTSMRWHHCNRSLALGFKDGQISLWSVSNGIKNGKTSRISSNISVHRSAITIMIWNYSGSRLVTGDNKGTACVWQSDRGLSLSPIVQYRISSALTAAVFVDNAHLHTKDSKVHNFFFASESGTVCFANDAGRCTTVQQLGCCVDSILFYESKMRVIIITRSLLVVQLHIIDDSHVNEIKKMKISVSSPETLQKGISQVIWAGKGLLAAATRENFIRLWDLSCDESYTLSLDNGDHDSIENAVTIDFDHTRRYLAAGTTSGHVTLWKFTGDHSINNGSVSSDKSAGAKSATSAKDWEVLSQVHLGNPVERICWNTAIAGHGSSDSFLGVISCSEKYSTYILSETILHAEMNSLAKNRSDFPNAVIQVSNRDLSVEFEISEHDCCEKKNKRQTALMIKCDINIKAISVSGNTIAVLSGRHAQVIHLLGLSGTPNITAPFQTDSKTVIVDEKNNRLFLPHGYQIDILDLSGNVKSSIAFNEKEGKPVLMDKNQNILVVCTENGVLNLFDISKISHGDGNDQGIIPLYRTITFSCSMAEYQDRVIRSLRCSATGPKFSILCNRVSAYEKKSVEPDTCVYVYDAEKDAFDHFDFGPTGRYPAEHRWDFGDPRLLVCEIKGFRKNISILSSNNDKCFGVSQKGIGADITALFVTSDRGILVQDSIPVNSPLENLVGVQIPYCYFTSLASSPDSSNPQMNLPDRRILSKRMRDFSGIDKTLLSRPDITLGLLDFSYYLATGDIDKAYSSVRLLNCPSVWESMARMCVKTKRLDVAEVCFSNMGHGRGARAIRLAKEKHAELEVQIAQVAIQLGMLDDAIELYKSCNRYDLLVVLYRDSNQWDEAISTAETHDKIHLQVTHHKYAKYLEDQKDIKLAMRHYKIAGTHYMEVTRMLLEQGMLDELEIYVMNSQDQKLLKWWAKYCESISDIETAKLYYHRASDHLSLVRLACYTNDFESAENIVEKSNSQEAAYFLGRQYEARQKYKDAIRMYGKSERVQHGIGLALAFGFESELYNLAIQCQDSKIMLDAAKFLEERGSFEKSAKLYNKAGDLSAALELCLKAGSNEEAGIMDTLENVIEELEKSSNIDEKLLERCTNFFIQHNHLHRAIEILARNNDFSKALHMCREHEIKITDELAERLTPSNDSQNRLEILFELANTCKKQREYHLACKKYTQAGDRLKAMKCLLKTGDTKNIIHYASVGRSKDMYVLAANYLQNLDWHSDSDIMNAIVGFYTKAKAFEPLSLFYQACAQHEVQEYRDYEKALGALREAEKCLKGVCSNNQNIAELQKRIDMVNKFIAASQSAIKDPPEMLRLCHSLLENLAIDSIVRMGDCCALIIDWHARQSDWQQVVSTLFMMQAKNVPPTEYIPKKIIDRACTEVKIEPQQFVGKIQANAQEDEISEDLDEEFVIC